MSAEDPDRSCRELDTCLLVTDAPPGSAPPAAVSDVPASADETAGCAARASFQIHTCLAPRGSRKAPRAGATRGSGPISEEGRRESSFSREEDDDDANSIDARFRLLSAFTDCTAGFSVEVTWLMR